MPPAKAVAKLRAEQVLEGAIVVAHDLSPTDTIGFKDHAVAGFITDVGGPTGHTAIVARSLSIPAVVALRHIRHVVKDDELIIIDGIRGVVIVDPDERVLEEYRLRKAAVELERSKLKRLKSTRAATLDGEEVQILANIELPPDAIQAKGVEADGVGLFRTEFLFMSRDSWPDEDEQFEAYKSVVKTMAGKPVTVRTLDVGADKELEGATRQEDNPALGLRAIRYCLAEPKMFLTQLRALLRASHFGRMKILIPMLASSHEIDQTLILLDKAKAQLRATRHKFDENIRIGGMIEVPSTPWRERPWTLKEAAPEAPAPPAVRDHELPRAFRRHEFRLPEQQPEAQDCIVDLRADFGRQRRGPPHDARAEACRREPAQLLGHRQTGLTETDNEDQLAGKLHVNAASR